MIEPGPLGGKARTLEPAPGWRIENGPHTFLARAVRLAELARTLGLPLTRLPSGARFLYTDGRLESVGPLWLLRRPSLILGVFRASEDRPEDSVLDVFRRRFGPAIEAPLRAMMAGIWSAPPERLEIGTAFPKFVGKSIFSARGGPTGTFTIPGGLGAIAEAARARLDIIEAQAVRVTTGAVETTTGTLEADHVIVATEAPNTAKLLGFDIPVTYASLAVAHWTAESPALPHGFGCLSTDPGSAPALGTIFASDLFPDRAPAGLRTFTTMFGGLYRPADASLDAQGAAQRLLDAYGVRPKDVFMVHHAHAVAVPEPGHRARVAAARAALPPRVHLAGSWTGAAAMEDAVESGERAAEAVHAA